MNENMIWQVVDNSRSLSVKPVESTGLGVPSIQLIRKSVSKQELKGIPSRFRRPRIVREEERGLSWPRLAMLRGKEHLDPKSRTGGPGYLLLAVFASH